MTIQHGRVLILDDEELIRNMARDLLNALGYESDSAEEGGEAVSLYRLAFKKGEPYCVVLIDLTIARGMSGLEAANRIREIDPDASLVVSSGFSEERVMEHYQEYGFVASMPKPYRMMDLKAVLERFCGAGS